MKKVSKAQVGAKKKAAVDSVPSEMFPGKMIPKSKSNYATGRIAKMIQSGKPKVASKKKMGGKVVKSKKSK